MGIVTTTTHHDTGLTVIYHYLIVIANYYILITLTTYISQLAKSGLLKAKRLKKYPCLEYKTN